MNYLSDKLFDKDISNTETIIKALDAALETRHFSKSIISKRFHTRYEPNLWMPKTYSELFDGYRKAFSVLFEFWEQQNDFSDMVEELLLSRSRGLLLIHDLSEEYLKIYIKLYDGTNKKYKIYDTTRVILKYEKSNLSIKTTKRLEELIEDYEASSIKNQFHKLVLNPTFDDYAAVNNEKSAFRIEFDDFTRKMVDDIPTFLSYLPYLMQEGDRGNQFEFGKNISLIDEDYTIYTKVTEFVIGNEPIYEYSFFKGLLVGIRLTNHHFWETEVLKLLDLNNYDFSIVLLSTGSSDKIMDRIMQKLTDNEIEQSVLQHLRIHSEFLSKDKMEELLLFIFELDDYIFVKISFRYIFEYYIANKESIPAISFDLYKSYLKLIATGIQKEIDQKTSFYFTSLILKLLDSPFYQFDMIFLSLINISRIEEILIQRDGIFNKFEQVIEMEPKKYWDVISEVLEKKEYLDQRSSIERWLGSRSIYSKTSGLRIFPFSVLTEWIGKDRDRINTVLYCLSGDMYNYPDSIASSFIKKYGTTKKIRENISSRHQIRFWTGSKSVLINKQIDSILS